MLKLPKFSPNKKKKKKYNIKKMNGRLQIINRKISIKLKIQKNSFRIKNKDIIFNNQIYNQKH